MDWISVAIVFTGASLLWAFVYPRLFPKDEDKDKQEPVSGVSANRHLQDLESTNRILLEQINKSLEERERLLKERAKLLETNKDLTYLLKQHNIVAPSDKEREVNRYAKALGKLSAQEIETLAFGSFKEVYDEFAPEQSLDWRRVKLASWAERNNKLSLLKREILKINSAAFDD